MSAAQLPESWIKEICAVSCALIHTGWWWKSEKHAAAARWCVRKVSLDLFLCVFSFFNPAPSCSTLTLKSTYSSFTLFSHLHEHQWARGSLFVPSLLLVLYFVCGVFKSVCVCSLREAAYVLVGQLKKKPSPTWTLCLSAHRVPRLILRTVYSSTPLSPLVCDRYSAVRGESVTGFARAWCGYKHSTSGSFPLIFPVDILTVSQPSCKNNLHINVSENFCNCAHTHMKVYVSLTVTSALFFNPFLIS